MTLVRTQSSRDRFQDLFDDLLAPEFYLRGRSISPQVSLPKINIKEGDNAYVLEVAAPGIAKEDFNIQLEDGLLTVSSQKKEEKEEENKKYYKREFSHQTFKRSFRLPENVDAENITANYVDGVLSVQVPLAQKAKEDQPKLIQIS